MKAIIENPLTGRTEILVFIINLVTDAKNEKELREVMNKNRDYIEDGFLFGFGSSHMWVCRKDDPDHKRIIFVEL